MDYYKEIKSELLDVAIHKKVNEYYENKYELEKYYNVGKLLIDAQGGEARAKYGNGLIKEYAKRLMNEIDKKYSYRNLMYMRRFYILFKDEKVNAVRSALSWTHYQELLLIKDINVINYYFIIEKGAALRHLFKLELLCRNNIG